MAEPNIDPLRQRMAQVRAELLHDSRRLRESAQTLTDWRYYVRRYPWAILGASAVAGYLVIPKRAPQPAADAETIAKLLEQHRLEVRAPTAAPGMLQSLTSSLGSTLLKAGLTYVGHYLSQSLAAGVQDGRASEANGAPSHQPANE
jgi:hypothetical protein